MGGISANSELTVESSRESCKQDSIDNNKRVSHVDQHLARSLRIEVGLVDIVCEDTADCDVLRR